MEGNDFVDKSSQGSASKSKGAKDDSKFVRPLPVTPKAKEKSSGRRLVSVCQSQLIQPLLQES